MQQHIVLVNPEIPQNTGNIGRLCVAIDAILHLIYPLGFEIHAKHVRRAGLDYWDRLHLQEHKNIESFFTFLHDLHHIQHDIHHYALSSKATTSYFTMQLIQQDSKACFLYFGSETKGLSQEFHTYFAELCGAYIRIPMAQNCRCLNLSNSVAIVAYEILREIESLNQTEKLGKI